MYVRPISTRLFRGMLMPEMRAMPQPCRCLWGGLEQITRTAPWRRMRLHFSHIGLTDGRTFMGPFRGRRAGLDRRQGPAKRATIEDSTGLRTVRLGAR